MNLRIHAVIVVVAAIAFISVERASGGARNEREPVFYGTMERNEAHKLRAWIWEKWSHRVSATAVLKWNTIEGDGGTDYYSICKDKEGLWCLAIHSQGSDRPHFEGDQNKWRDEWTVAYSVERVKKRYLDELPGKPISPSRQLSPRQYSLELKDKNGRILYHY